MSILMNPEFWVAVAFVIFFALFGRMIWRPLVAMLDGRAERIAAELAQAERLRSEAQAMLLDAQAARDNALTEAKEILARGHAEAARLAEQAASDAAAQIVRRERMAQDRIAAAEKAAIAELRQTAAELAAAAAATVITETLTAADDARLIDHAIADVPRALRAA